MFKKLFYRAKESFWFALGRYCLFYLLLAIAVVYVDLVLNDFVNEYVPESLLTSVDLGKVILGTIAGALVTMTTITFSTIMVVLTTYTSQFSPRILKGFITKPSTMRVLGIFFGGIIYSILSLLFMRKAAIDNLIISSSVGVLVAFVCLAFFAFFIHDVASSIQVSNLINELTLDAMKTIKRERDALKKFKSIKVSGELHHDHQYSNVARIKQSNYGYIQQIDYEGLYKLASELNCSIEVNQYIGHYVTAKSEMVTIYFNGKKTTVNIEDYITVADERTAVQDIEFCMIKLIEIALRAISPGINDPNTAIDCIRFLRTPLLEALKDGGKYIYFFDEEDRCRLIKKKETTEQLLYTTFYQISHYGRQDISILLTMLDTLSYIAEHSDHHVKIEIKMFVEYVIGKFDANRIAHLDRKQVQMKLGRINAL